MQLRDSVVPGVDRETLLGSAVVSSNEPRCTRKSRILAIEARGRFFPVIADTALGLRVVIDSEVRQAPVVRGEVGSHSLIAGQFDDVAGVVSILSTDRLLARLRIVESDKAQEVPQA